ncbi:uncharacterized protein FIESC28_03389 [Fusarium coffeatum]|uniref:2EXR domain-containing protein n=1 Tax=Fusarium coffeatum TaxID=231269 RepID=A0A366S383_9HYPO|nr:uncharacterized protein FIESC28_03389 [Fusarium coffeatum]RBR23773.1 hypothetical protein FIESC28_03389 [Fusarium coffeatum]
MSESIILDVSRLPGELQTIIWRFVLRDDRPGVLVFGYHNVPNNDNAQNALSTNITTAMSSYLIERALWTLCHESRRVVLLSFVDQLQQHNAHRMLYLTPPVAWGPLNWPGLGARCPSMYFLNNGPDRQYITGAPTRDLFIFHIDQFEALGMITPPEAQGLRPAQTVTNVGIEFNPLWHDDEYYTSRYFENFQNMWRVLRGQERLLNLWIIDTSLKRKDDAPPLSGGLQSFFAQGKKFSQLEYEFFGRDAAAESLEHWDFVRPVKHDWQPASMSFVQDLSFNRDALDEQFANDYLYHPHQDWPRVGLLGWEELAPGEAGQV